ncbi:MAG: hypothetical protein AAGH40_10985 [Verrucomicrobiota bacterium]
MLDVDQIVIETCLALAQIVIPLTTEDLVKAKRPDLAPIAIKGFLAQGTSFSA